MDICVVTKNQLQISPKPLSAMSPTPFSRDQKPRVGWQHMKPSLLKSEGGKEIHQRNPERRDWL